MEEYFGVAKEEGISTQELGAVQAIVMAVSAGRVGAQVAEVRRRMARRTESGDAGAGS
jgi:hypothetical protein